MGMGAANAAAPAADPADTPLLRIEGGPDAAKGSASPLSSSASVSLLAAASPTITTTNIATVAAGSMRRRTQWLWLAMASGVCAALNGAFAKLCV